MRMEAKSVQNRFVIRCIVVFIFIFIAGCNAVEIESIWVDHKITVDGLRGSDWDGVMLKINDQPVGVGFQNDDDYLYLLFTTYDRDLQREILIGGLTIWFDSSGGDDKIFGIHFPLTTEQKKLSETPGLEEEKFQDEGARFEKTQFNVTDMDITGPSREKKQRVNVNQLKQIEAKIDVSGGNLTYELRVPFRDVGLDPYFIGTKAGNTIGVGIETSERLKERPTEFERRRRDAEELPPGLRDGGAGNSERETPYGANQKEPMSFWAKIKLAMKRS
jgi:hypothetical protein